jgi:hypothetical protein
VSGNHLRVCIESIKTLCFLWIYTRTKNPVTFDVRIKYICVGAVWLRHRSELWTLNGSSTKFGQLSQSLTQTRPEAQLWTNTEHSTPPPPPSKQCITRPLSSSRSTRHNRQPTTQKPSYHKNHLTAICRQSNMDRNVSTLSTSRSLSLYLILKPIIPST